MRRPAGARDPTILVSTEPQSEAAATRDRPARLAAVAAAAVALAALWSWPLAAHLSTHTAVSAWSARDNPNDTEGWKLIAVSDQALSIWQSAHNGRALLGGDAAALLAQPQCFPMPAAGALGEHMIEFGVLSAPWLAITRDPIAAYNLALATSVAIGAVGMFLYLRLWSVHAGAAFVAAIAFALAPTRLHDLVVHPAVEGFHWFPWVLWAFDRCLAGGGAARALALAVSLGLGGLVGGYPLLALAATGGAYGAIRVAGSALRGRLAPSALAWTFAGALPALALVGGILLVYREVAATWVVAEPERPLGLLERTEFLFGGIYFPGLFAAGGAILLAALRPMRERGPCAALAAAAFAVYLLVGRGPLWTGGPEIGALYPLLSERLPLLASVRAPLRAAAAVGFALQALGAIGWGRLLERCPPAVARMAATALLAAVVADLFLPAWERLQYGPLLETEIVRAAPPASLAAELREAVAEGNGGAVLDLPAGRMARAGGYLTLAAYHGAPTSACYQSLTPILEPEVARLAARVTNDRGAGELAAAGFALVVLHPAQGRPVEDLSLAMPSATTVVRRDDAIAYRLPIVPAVHHDATLLELRALSGETRRVGARDQHELALMVTNRGESVWTPPAPLTPLEARVEFRDAQGSLAKRTRGRFVATLALAGRSERPTSMILDEGPAPGRYDVSVFVPAWQRRLDPASIAWTSRAEDRSP